MPLELLVVSMNSSEIDIKTGVKPELRIRLQKDNNDVEIERKKGTSSWVPSRSL